MEWGSTVRRGPHSEPTLVGFQSRLHLCDAMTVRTEHVAFRYFTVDPIPPSIVRKAMHWDRLAARISVMKIVDDGREPDSAATLTTRGHLEAVEESPLRPLVCLRDRLLDRPVGRTDSDGRLLAS